VASCNMSCLPKKAETTSLVLHSARVSATQLRPCLCKWYSAHVYSFEEWHGGKLDRVHSLISQRRYELYGMRARLNNIHYIQLDRSERRTAQFFCKIFP